MDFYRLFSVHIRAWTPLEIICFLMAAAGTGIVLVRAVRCHRMKISQAISAFAFFVFLSLVFASTVFTRSVGTRQCELIPLWSWAEVIFRQNWYLLEENILNVLLFLPIGCLIPFVYGQKVLLKKALGIGFCISAVIEICQLIFMRGLFEWDDMLHNALGCMIGCFVVNLFWRK